MLLPDRVLATLRTHRMLEDGRRVLVALSGGPDSVALVHLMRALEARAELSVAGVAHFNHRLRAAADEDEQFCRELASELGLALEAGSGDVRASARQHGRSIEDAARALRYGFLHDAAERLGADVIAVGHSLDDQAETFLLRLIRGAGPRGLAGIRPRAGRVIRPLLDISRDDLRRYASVHGLRFREDETNADRSIPRNRVRHELMPLLREYSPAIERVLAREAGIAREDEDRLQQEAIELAGSIVLRGKRGIELDVERLRSAPPALASRVVRLALEQGAPGRFFGAGDVERVLTMAGDSRPIALDLPGQTASRVGDRIVLGAPAEAAFSNSFRFPLSIPGEVMLTDWSVSAETLEVGSAPGSWSRRRPEETAAVATVAIDALRLPLSVRNRRRGDRFRPLGMGGKTRKLQDFLVDRKVARADRDGLPLVVDREERIVWVVGHAVGEEFRVTKPSQGVILLKARRLGGAG
jgi:tRNA(Ile)-lysidine synthase